MFHQSNRVFHQENNSGLVVKQDLIEIGIQGTEIYIKETFKSRIENIKSFQEKIKPRAEAPWTEERRRQQNERMDENQSPEITVVELKWSVVDPD